MAARHCLTNVRVDAGYVQPQWLDRAGIETRASAKKACHRVCGRRDPIVDTICAAVRARDALADNEVSWLVV
jgi:hypothetical protein